MTRTVRSNSRRDVLDCECRRRRRLDRHRPVHGQCARDLATSRGRCGAGAILQSRGNVQGMTTAAGIWVVAAIGLVQRRPNS
ncbi:MAG: MgtC/SapB family protein [Planctomycetes bacterium]|nr:MgtC/SapB family protein [Planctomycetota bacterium]